MAFSELKPIGKLIVKGQYNFRYPFLPKDSNALTHLDILISKRNDGTLLDDYSRSIRSLIHYYKMAVIPTISSMIINIVNNKAYVRTTHSFNMLLEDILNSIIAYKKADLEKYYYIKTMEEVPNLSIANKDININIEYKHKLELPRSTVTEFRILLRRYGIEYIINMLDLLRLVYITSNRE